MKIPIIQEGAIVRYGLWRLKTGRYAVVDELGTRTVTELLGLACRFPIFPWYGVTVASSGLQLRMGWSLLSLQFAFSPEHSGALFSFYRWWEPIGKQKTLDLIQCFGRPFVRPMTVCEFRQALNELQGMRNRWVQEDIQ